MKGEKKAKHQPDCGLKAAALLTAEAEISVESLDVSLKFSAISGSILTLASNLPHSGFLHSSI